MVECASVRTLTVPVDPRTIEEAKTRAEAGADGTTVRDHLFDLVPIEIEFELPTD